jgi:hypothetical protein
MLLDLDFVIERLVSAHRPPIHVSIPTESGQRRPGLRRLVVEQSVLRL